MVLLKITARLILLLITSDAFGGESAGFLSKSKILEANQVSIVPVKRLSRGSVAPLYESQLDGGLYLITRDGFRPLSTIPTQLPQKTGVRACGHEIMTRPWKVADSQNDKDIFAAFGRGIDRTSITWFPAHEVVADKDDVVRCLNRPPTKSITYLKLGRVDGDRHIFYSAKLADKTNSKRPSVNNEQDERICDRKSFETIGSASTKTKCETFIRSDVDCDEHGFMGGSLLEPLGLLNIVSGKNVEKWVVYNALGREGAAFVGIRLSAENHNYNDDDIVFYVYSGC